ncbi:DNA-binding protein [Pseudomonas aeruginosa]
MQVEIGLCKGTSSRTRGDYEEIYVLVADEKPDQYGQLVAVTVGIRMSKGQLEAGLRDLYDTLAGKQICVPTFDRPWQSKDKNKFGVEKWLSRDGKPLPLVSSKQAS